MLALQVLLDVLFAFAGCWYGLRWARKQLSAEVESYKTLSVQRLRLALEVAEQKDKVVQKNAEILRQLHKSEMMRKALLKSLRSAGTKSKSLS